MSLICLSQTDVASAEYPPPVDGTLPQDSAFAELPANTERELDRIHRREKGFGIGAAM